MVLGLIKCHTCLTRVSPIGSGSGGRFAFTFVMKVRSGEGAPPPAEPPAPGTAFSLRPGESGETGGAETDDGALPGGIVLPDLGREAA
jgi:hypothetical protein